MLFFGVGKNFGRGGEVSIPENMCDVTVCVINQHQEPIEGAEITAALKERTGGTSTKVVLGGRGECEVFRTDASGIVVIRLIWSSQFQNGGTYLITVRDNDDLLSFEFTVPDETQAIATVPETTTVNGGGLPYKR